jgi:hypothetical protein
LKYKLTDKDYRRLWMVASPAQIVEEFGDRSHSTRTIYRILKKYGISGIGEIRKQLKTELLIQQPLLEEYWITQKLKAKLEERRVKGFAEMWTKIEEFEARF